MHLYLTSPIPPSVNHYLSYRVVGSGKEARAMSYKTKPAKTYRQEFADYVREEAVNQGWETNKDKSQHYYVDAVFYFDRTDKDCNNYFKVMLDAITDTGLIWPDDNVVCERVQRILYDGANPRIELDIHPVDYVGIFDSASQLEAFTSRCLRCTRYCRNCSILRKAKAGRIQADVEDGVCHKYKEKKDKN